jgi:hypothetical protein
MQIRATVTDEFLSLSYLERKPFFKTDSETGQLGQMTDAVLLSFHKASANFLKSTEDIMSVPDQQQMAMV